MTAEVTGLLPSVSLIIPAYNEEERIEACLRAAIAQTVPLDEIIVVDNRSTDGTADTVRRVARQHPNQVVRLIAQNERQGLIPTRDAGFDAATSDVLGRIDADSLLAPEWSREVRRAFRNQHISALTGPVMYYDMPFRRFGLRADDRFRKLLMRLNREYRFVFGSNMAVRADAWNLIRDEVCPDEGDLLHEDIDLSIHLAENGLFVGYESNMVCGISARRMDSKFRDYSDYVQRFRRTYRAHSLNRGLERIPQAVLYMIYPSLHGLRQIRHLGTEDVERSSLPSVPVLSRR
ncbi:glycosyltransferase [Pseudoclavibacter sp. CFCC 13611]|uniref:glycosyltransferase n=1 Tax=Pseudoclavibacter sp. CFCC 13611 TaxID=2615178 RepID=UPI001CE4207A|nr:glycosyltransferase family 2 protein [Pseudoclavibacter sp. CFCC 13611]